MNAQDEQRQVDAYLAQHFGVKPDPEAEQRPEPPDDGDPDLHPGTRTDRNTEADNVDRYMKAHRLGG